MGLFFRKKFKPPVQPRPQWLNALLILLVLYVIAQALKTDEENPNEVRKAVDTVGQKLSAENIDRTIDSYKSVLFPNYSTSMDIKDELGGKGAPLVCGQEAKIAYSTKLVGGRDLPFGAGKEEPLSFRLGDGSTIPAIEQGITGMRVGGKRSLIASPAMAYGIKKFAKEGEAFTPDDRIQISVELLAASPEVPDVRSAPFRYFTTASSIPSATIYCGQSVSANVTLWDLEGKKLDARTIRFTVGKGEVFYGLEQGVIGQSRGTTRTLIVPPSFQNTIGDKEPSIHFPLPQAQTVLVEAEALP